MAIYFPETCTCENGTPAQLLNSELNAISGLRGTGPSLRGMLSSGGGVGLALALVLVLERVLDGAEDVLSACDCNGAATAQLVRVAASSMKPRRDSGEGEFGSAESPRSEALRIR